MTLRTATAEQTTVDREVRVAAIGLETRGDGDEQRTMVGHAALFNNVTNIGNWYREQIAPGAFATAIKEDDVRALVDHEPSRILGRNTAGTLSLREDKKGLLVEITPPDTQLARDLIVSMERGDVTQMSFAFTVRSQKWDDLDDEESNELPMRTLLDVRLYDVSVVTYPAYPDTEVGVRSLQAARKAGLVTPATLARVKMRQRLIGIDAPSAVD